MGIGADGAETVMDYRREYRIDSSGAVAWHDGLVITDEALKLAYHTSGLIMCVVEHSAVMGVKVGAA